MKSKLERISIVGTEVSDSRIAALKRSFRGVEDKKAQRQIRREIQKVEKELRHEVAGFWNDEG